MLLRNHVRVQARLHELYHGESRRSARFQFWHVLADLALIVFFVAAPLLRDSASFILIDYAVAGLLALDLAARSYASGNVRDWLRNPLVWVDAFILLTLLMPEYLSNFGFLRAIKIWTLVHSPLFWRAVGNGRYDNTNVEEVTKAAATLATFVFMMTGLVYTSFLGHTGLNTYLDALYFTMTTLTTTGYGDITLPAPWGRVLSIFMMLAGITLFLRLAQAVIRPRKVRFQCHSCGLQRHDLDAVHCKACGTLLNIPNDED